MPAPAPFFPHPLFTGDETRQKPSPRVFASPGRYIQGAGVLGRLGDFLAMVPSVRPVILLSAGGKRRFSEAMDRSFEAAGVTGRYEIFEGECSFEEVDRVVAALALQNPPVDAVIGVGGGKCLDAAKCVAFRLHVPVVICPTIASTDAPCSAVSVMYSQEGEGRGPEFFPHSPALVVVDTDIILASPARHLIAGMGDALATWYEAKTCYDNPNARSMVGGRMTLAALAIAELCAKTIYAQGQQAAEAVRQQRLNDAFENVVEANTLLSGIGFESGGLSIAHAVAAGLTVIPVLHREYLHGELVGVGTLIHLLMAGQQEEAAKAARFLASVGLPVVLEQLSLTLEQNAEQLKQAMTAAVESTLANSAPFTVTSEALYSALVEAQALGRRVLTDMGDAPYRALHG